MLRQRLNSPYSPLYFLAALGGGGLAVSFYIYLMFLLPHPNTPMVTFSDLQRVFDQGDPVNMSLTAAVLLTIAVFAFWHFRLLWWNAQQWRAFVKTPAYAELQQGNAEISLMSIPLTLAMSVNVLFVLGALFVPGLWSVVEWLFPLAILAFTLIGLLALRILLTYFARVLIGGKVDFATNNSLAPMISLFALAMITVGLAAPASMSHNSTTIAVAIALSLFFFTIAALLSLIKLVNGFASMMAQGINESASPSLWIMIPILTLLGISTIRLTHGLHHGFDNPLNMSSLYVLSAIILSAQILFGLLGYAVMQRLNYFRDYLHGDKGNAGSFALVCPGVAFFVFGMFFLNIGLTQNQIISQGSWLYFLLMLPFVWVQIKTIQVFFGLKRRILSEPRQMVPKAA